MKVGNVVSMGLMNYGIAVAAVPLTLAGQTGVVTTQGPSPRVQIRSSASSEYGMWLDSEWSEMQSALAKVLLRTSVAAVDALSWYETAGDAVYPAPGNAEILDVEVVDDESEDAFTFTDSGFDVWTW